MKQASIRHDEETVRALVSTRYQVFNSKQRILTILSGVALMLIGLFAVKTEALTYVLLFVGAVIITGYKAPEKQTYESMLKVFGGDLPAMRYLFQKDAISIETTRKAETLNESLPYRDIIRLVKTPQFDYAFNKDCAACMMDVRKYSSKERNELEKFLADKVGLEWTTPGSLMTLSLPGILHNRRNTRRF